MIKYGLSIVAFIFIAGCTTSSNNSAAAFMREQQEKQAHINRAEAAEAENKYKDQPSMLITLIEENIMQRRYFAAHAYINSYKQQYGADPTINLLQATTLRHLGHLDQAQSIYEQALAGPKKAQALHGLGLIAARQSKMALAVQLLQQSTQLDPVNATLLSDLGYALLVTKDLPNARMALGQAIELAPDNPRIVANAALLLILDQQPQRADQLMTASGMNATEQTEVYALATHFSRPDTPQIQAQEQVHATLPTDKITITTVEESPVATAESSITHSRILKIPLH